MKLKKRESFFFIFHFFAILFFHSKKSFSHKKKLVFSRLLICGRKARIERTALSRERARPPLSLFSFLFIREDPSADPSTGSLCFQSVLFLLAGRPSWRL